MDGVGDHDYNEFTAEPQEVTRAWGYQHPDRPFVMTAKNSEAKIDIFGLTEIDAYDFGEGLAGSVLKRDVRDEWQGCVEGIPEFFLSILDVYGGFQITNPLGPFYAMTDMTKITDVGNVIMQQALKVPGEMTSCKTVMTDVMDFFSFGMSNFSVALISTGLMTNFTTNFMKLFGSMGVAMTSAVAHDYYKAG